MDIDKLDEELIHKIEALLQPFMEVDYTPDSLLELEWLIQRQFPKKGKPKIPTMILPFGVVLGETVVRNIPRAKWVLKGNLYDAKISFFQPNGVRAEAMPFVRVAKFFEDRTDGLKAWYDGINLISLGMMPKVKEKAPDGQFSEWQETSPGGIKFRIKHEKKEDKKK